MVFMFAKHSHFDCFLRLLVDAFTSFSCFFAPGGSLGAFWEPLGSLLCAFWGLLGVSWKPLGLLLVRLGRLFGSILGLSWARPGRVLDPRGVLDLGAHGTERARKEKLQRTS